MPDAPVRIVAPTIVRFTFKHLLPGGRPWNAIVDLSMDEVATTRHEAVAELAGGVSAPWQDDVVATVQSGITYQGAHYIDLDSLGGITGDVGPTAGHPSTGGGSSAGWTPPNVSVLVTKSCGATRGQRNGRMYIPSIPEDQIDNGGILTPGTVTLWTAKMNALKGHFGELDSTSIATVAWRVVHCDRHDSPAPADWTWSSSDITSFQVSNRAATQRRRLRG